MAARVLLVRHAQSTWNALGRWQGWADPPLSDDGMKACVDAAAHPALDGAAAIVSSDLTRAVTTATLLAGDRGVPHSSLRGLRERGAGHWTGLRRDDIEAGWPGALDASPPSIPGGEPVASATARAVAALHRIAEQWDGMEVVAVSHGALIRLVELHVTGEQSPVWNLSGHWLEVSRSALRVGPTVRLLPDGGR